MTTTMPSGLRMSVFPGRCFHAPHLSALRLGDGDRPQPVRAAAGHERLSLHLAEVDDLRVLALELVHDRIAARVEGQADGLLAEGQIVRGQAFWWRLFDDWRI